MFSFYLSHFPKYRGGNRVLGSLFHVLQPPQRKRPALPAIYSTRKHPTAQLLVPGKSLSGPESQGVCCGVREFLV